MVSVTPTSTSVTEGNAGVCDLSIGDKSETAVTVNFAKQTQTAGASDYDPGVGITDLERRRDGRQAGVQATAAKTRSTKFDETFTVNLRRRRRNSATRFAHDDDH